MEKINLKQQRVIDVGKIFLIISKVIERSVKNIFKSYNFIHNSALGKHGNTHEYCFYPLFKLNKLIILVSLTLLQLQSSK